MATIAFSPDQQNELIQTLASQFEISPDFINDITKKALAVVKSAAKKYNVTNKFKKSNVLDIVASAFKLPSPPTATTKTDTTNTDTQHKEYQKEFKQLLKGLLSITKAAINESTIEVAPKDSKTATQADFFSKLNLPPNKESSENKTEEKSYFKKSMLVEIDGITETGARILKQKMPLIFEDIIDKLKTETVAIEKEKGSKEKYTEGGLLGLLPKGLLAMGGGLALLLGGLAALVTGLQTDGQFKGLLKIFSNVGLAGGLKLLEKGAKTFIDTLKNFIDAPIKLLDTVGTGLKGALSSLLPKGIGNIVKGTASIFTRMLGGLVKFITPILKKLPLIGTVISLGFAYTRFKSGDVVGGIIDVLSGIASIFPGVGTGIAIGLDVLNAFLDYKTGGATKETSQKKTGILKEWMFGLGKWFKDNAENFPLIGTLIKTGRLFSEGKWTEGLVAFSKIIPGTSWLLDLVGFTEDKQIAHAKASQDIIGDLWNWMQTTMWEKITNAASWLVDGVKSWWSNLSWDPRTWVGGVEQGAPENLIKQGKPMKDGGIVKEPINAVIGEAGPEAVVPLEKYFDPKLTSLNNNALEEIVKNTNNTNTSLEALSNAIFKLAQVFNGKPNNNNNIIVNEQKQPENYPSASQVAASNIDPIRQVRMQFAI